MTTPSIVQPNPQDITADMITDCGLTPRQLRQWEDTCGLMIYACQGFRYLMFKMLHNHKGSYVCLPCDKIPVAATDGKNLLVNPNTFFQYDLAERVFIVGHEIVHCVYNDVDFINRCRNSGTVPMSDGSTLPYDEKTMQHSMDYRINALLKESNIGKPPKGCLLDPKIATSADSVVDVYKKVYEDYKQNGQLGSDGFDVILIPGTSTGQSAQAAAQNQQQWQIEVAAANKIEEAQRQQGAMPAGLKRFFDSILNPEIPWIEKLKAICVRKLGSGVWDWRKPDRRFIVRDLYVPSRSGFGAGHIVVWGDTSGSRNNAELAHNISECTGLMEEARPERLTILWCDADIHRIDELEDPSDMADLRHVASTEGVGGGGGTSIMPVFDWINDLDRKPEALIAFTDGYVTIPHIEPDYPVIWVSSAKKANEYPWGDVIEVKIKGGAA